MILKEEAWDTVYSAHNVNQMFNNFHCILLRYSDKFSYYTKVTGLKTNGLWKVLIYEVRGNEIFILYTETQILSIRNTVQFYDDY